MASSLLARVLPASKPLILCIEDNPVYLSLRKAVLERSGYNVIGVITADDALSALRDCPVSAVIADHLLEGTTGTELAKQMKQLKPDIPIILFSGGAPRDLSCVDVFVRKGESTEKLLSIVRDVVLRSCS